MIRAFMIALCALALPAAAQTATPPTNPRVAFETEAGRFVLEVYADKAPITAANFLRYVDARRLDGISFYRVVKVQDRFGFVQLGLQNDPKRVFPPVRHEPTTLTGIKHLDGTISMPRVKVGSAQGEFTISLGDQPSFDANPANPGDNLGYAAFGRVVEGMDVVLKVFDAPVSPSATLRGGVFKGEVPVKPVRVLAVRRVKP
ncbi:peptidylprolyl isomerase [Sphingomonas sp.]|jgi:peptidyl-prolyl cis-trans isomerase A (cyclophilin A)|uniref:peptidylprolyl isomerase n=1 Tax=Sphingomonas sp. TaxID=28214 RepID=UPI002EDB571C